MRGKAVWKHVCIVTAALAASATAASAQLAGTTTTSTTTTTTVSNTTSVLPSTSGPKLGSAHVIEWDLPEGFDFNPGAVAVDTRGEDNNSAWFVTRIGPFPDLVSDPVVRGNRKVYRFDFSPSLMKNGGNARWTSWELSPEVEMTGGVAKIRLSHDRRFAIVRTNTSIQEIDTQACFAGTLSYPTQCAAALRRWDVPEDTELPGSLQVSDIAVDDGRRIFTVGLGSTEFDQAGYVQMLVPTRVPYTSSTVAVEVPAGTVTRWSVLGVNQCGANNPGLGGPCNSGIDLQPDNKNQNLIYFSNQFNNAIEELNITTNTLRRWVLPSVNGETPQEPRQLKINNNGIVWVLTGSGHIVSLNPKNYSGCSNGYNKMTVHRIPPGALDNDPWGIAPDSDVIGYTDANNGKVGMLLPHDSAKCVPPAGPFPVEKRDMVATVTTVPTSVVSDVVMGTPKIVAKQTTSKQDGTFVEALISQRGPDSDMTMKQPDSLSPLGITPVKWKGQGTFLYAVGFTGPSADEPALAKRIGFVRLGIPEKIKNPRDDDDADDGMDRNEHRGWHQSEQGDDDGDGVGDEYDTPDHKERMSSYDQASTPAFSASTYYPVSTTASTLTLLATAKADDPLATIAVDIYDAMGLLVATSGPLPGVATVTLLTPGAGNYNVCVRNLSGRAVNVTPMILMRDASQ